MVPALLRRCEGSGPSLSPLNLPVSKALLAAVSSCSRPSTALRLHLTGTLTRMCQ